MNGEKNPANEKKIYSHSRLSTFEQCPFKYKCRYIDKFKPDFDQSVEAYLGKCVHETLEWIYSLSKNPPFISPSLDSVIEHFSKNWKEKIKQDIRVVSPVFKLQDYFNKGINFLVGYYVRHQPFRDGTVELEMEVQIDLFNDGKYMLRGFIDRLVFNEQSREYEIHDYKTGALPKNMEKFETDRQLSLYSLAISNLFGKDKKICLVWHYLAHDQKICIYRTNEQLESAKKEIAFLINKIESMNEKEFHPSPSGLCGWCEFKSKCPVFNPEIRQKKLS